MGGVSERAPDEVGWDSFLERSRLDAVTSSPVHQPLLLAVLTWVHERLAEAPAFHDVTFGIIPVSHHGGRYLAIGLRVLPGRDPEQVRKDAEAWVNTLVERASVSDFLEVAGCVPRSYDELVTEQFNRLEPASS